MSDQKLFAKCPFPMKEGKIICMKKNINAEDLYDHLLNEPHHTAAHVAERISKDAMKLLQQASGSSTTTTTTTNVTEASKSSRSNVSSFTINNLTNPTGPNCNPVIHTFVGGFNNNQSNAATNNTQEQDKSDEVDKDPPNKPSTKK